LEVIMRHRHRHLQGRPYLAGRVSVIAVLGTVILGTGVLLAGCSSAGGPGQAVASLPGHGGSTQAAQPPSQQQSDQDMVNFARCMISHGVQMSQPFHRAGHAGLTLDIPSRGPATNAAFAACTHYIQPIIAAKQAGAAAQAAPHLAALTRYAQCMRRHDISLLDPTPLGAVGLGHVPGISNDFGRYSPQFRAADAACRHYLPADIHDDGTGP
jgi:hypothetical protein